MNKDSAYYCIAIVIHSLIKNKVIKKTKLKKELNRIIDEMYKTFDGKED